MGRSAVRFQPFAGPFQGHAAMDGAFWGHGRFASRACEVRFGAQGTEWGHYRRRRVTRRVWLEESSWRAALISARMASMSDSCA
eukprot:2279618-Rhodomonas_salina.1